MGVAFSAASAFGSAGEGEAAGAAEDEAGVPPVSFLGSAFGVAAFSGAAGVVALLKEFGVSKGPELKPDQFVAFGEKIDALLAGGDLA